MLVGNQNCIHEEIREYMWGMRATIQFRIFCLPTSSLKT